MWVLVAGSWRGATHKPYPSPSPSPNPYPHPHPTLTLTLTRAGAHHLCVALEGAGLVDGEEEDDALGALCATCGWLGVRGASGRQAPARLTAPRGTENTERGGGSAKWGLWQRGCNERAPNTQS